MTHETRQPGFWYNYRTGQDDYRTTPESDAEMQDYIPQLPATKTLYQFYRQRGDTPLDALIKVLKATMAAGNKQQEPPAPQQEQTTP